MAIAYAIDKEAMNLACFDGLALDAKYMVREHNTGAPTDVTVYEYNVAKAKEYLAKSAYPNGVHLGAINCSAGLYFEKMAQVLQDNLAAIGLTTDINRLESATNLNRSRNQEYELLVTGFAANGDFDSWKMYCHTNFRGSFYNVYEGNKFDWKRMNSLWETGVAATSVKERQAIYGDLYNMLMATATQLPVFHRVSPFVWTTDLVVPVNYPNYPIVYEWSWK
jgi:ABC-type transport system substrate-binding protein